MKGHFDMMKYFEKYLNQAKLDKLAERESKPVDKAMFAGLLIHLFDLCSQAKPWELAWQWSIRVNTEFIQ